MPSDFLTPFLELDEEFYFAQIIVIMDKNAACKPNETLRGHFVCPPRFARSAFESSSGLILPVTLQRSRNAESSRLFFFSLLCVTEFPMIEGAVREDKTANAFPPGPCVSSSSSLSSTASPSPHISTRYKTELCRTYEESGTCKYGTKCQFAHGLDELRGLSRHPKYKTEPCRTFHTIGFCPYGARCHFIHNADELPAAAAPAQKQKPRPPLLRHSLSFAGFSSSPQTFQPVEESQPSSLLFARASSVSPSPPSTGSPELLSPLFPEPGALKHFPYPFAGIGDLAGDDPRFSAATDSARCLASENLPYRLPQQPSLGAPPGLRRCSSADSLSEEGYTSSCSLSSSSSGAESPSFEGRRLPIFSRLSVSDE
uniref:mRNA decay activator protein ZFP36 n=1 Tax=Mola mola TaxID=94237 RepID=A0A3Q4B613_MOLML